MREYYSQLNDSCLQWRGDIFREIKVHKETKMKILRAISQNWHHTSLTYRNLILFECVFVDSVLWRGSGVAQSVKYPVANSWSQLRSWSQGCEFKPCIGLCTGRGAYSKNKQTNKQTILIGTVEDTDLNSHHVEPFLLSPSYPYVPSVTDPEYSLSGSVRVLNHIANFLFILALKILNTESHIPKALSLLGLLKWRAGTVW